MAITADKNGKGELTGRFRVELQKGKERYRQRHDTLAQAKDDESRVKALWEAGKASTPSVDSQGQSGGITIASGIELATGILWRNKASEGCNWAHIRIVGEVLGDQTLLDAIDTAGVRKVLQHLVKTGKSDGTANRYLSHLRTFLAWHIAEGNRTIPLEKIVWDWRKETKGRIRWLTPAEEAQMVSLVPENVGKLIQVAIRTGCRRDELITVEASQIEDNVLHLWKTKTDSPRSVPMDTETTAMLLDLVVNKTMPSRRTLRRRWEAAKVKMGLVDDNEFVFHACRHTCATRLLDADVDVLIIKEWLGHKRIETTQRYTHVKPRNLQSALAKMGNAADLLARNSSVPAAFSLPHTSPTAGVIDQSALAA